MPNYCSTDITTGINGYLLGCELDLTGGVIQVWTATSFKEEPVDSSIFIISSNYATMTMDEYTKRLATDKKFLKQCNKINEMTDDARSDFKKQQRKELWNVLAFALIAGVEVTQQIDAQQIMQKSPNSQTSGNYLNVVKNNSTLNPTDAINANNKILNNIIKIKIIKIKIIKSFNLFVFFIPNNIYYI